MIVYFLHNIQKNFRSSVYFYSSNKSFTMQQGVQNDLNVLLYIICCAVDIYVLYIFLPYFLSKYCISDLTVSLELR